jgi:hypothetical protein
MRAMPSSRRSLPVLWPLAALLAFVAAPSCGGGSAGDQTTNFVGPWTFQSGALTPVCPIPGLSPFDLTGLNLTLTKVDDATISLKINAACDVHFRVSGTSGTALPGQTCALDLGGALGMQSVAVTSWTLKIVGDEIDCTIAGKASICSASGTAVLVRGTTDAGVSNHDGGPHDGQAGSAEAGQDDLASEAGGTDGGVDGPTDVGGDDTGTADGGVEAGADAETGTDAGVDVADAGATG